MRYVCLKVSTKTDTVMFNFCQWCKTRSSAFSQKFSATTPDFFTFSVEPLVIYNRALYNWKLSHRLRDIRLLSIPWPWNPGWGSLKVIENYSIQSGTHDFLLTFHSNHRPISHRFRDKRPFPSKIANFPTPRVFNATAEGVPLGILYRRRGLRKPEWWGFQMVEKVFR